MFHSAGPLAGVDIRQLEAVRSLLRVTEVSLRPSFLVPCVAFLAVACQQKAEPYPQVGGYTGSGAWSGTPGGTLTGSNTATGGVGGGVVQTGTPCSTLPVAPVGWNSLFHVPSSEDFAFDALGNVLNIDDAANLFYSTPYSGTASVIAPYSSSEVGSIRFRVTGDAVVVADEGGGALMQLDLSGSSTVLLGSIPSPNSVAVHRDGWIYTTAQDQIWLVDPAGVNPAQLQIDLPGTDLDGLIFSNDYQYMFFNHDEDGLVYKSRVNGDGTLQPPTLIASVTVGWAELDGMAIDACDRIYVLITDGRIMVVRPDGQWTEWLDVANGGGSYTTSLHFGSGIGGWRTDHLYVMDRWGALLEIDVGVEGKPEPHL